LLILSFLSPSGKFGLMSDDLPKIVNGNFLKHLHHFCISDDQGFLLPEVYDRYKLLLHKNDLNIVIDSDKDMSKLLHFNQLIFNAASDLEKKLKEL
jgi:hypothetical protein